MISHQNISNMYVQVTNGFPTFKKCLGRLNFQKISVPDMLINTDGVNFFIRSLDSDLQALVGAICRMDFVEHLCMLETLHATVD